MSSSDLFIFGGYEKVRGAPAYFMVGSNSIIDTTTNIMRMRKFLLGQEVSRIKIDRYLRKVEKSIKRLEQLHPLWAQGLKSYYSKIL